MCRMDFDAAMRSDTTLSQSYWYSVKCICPEGRPVIDTTSIYDPNSGGMQVRGHWLERLRGIRALACCNDLQWTEQM